MISTSILRHVYCVSHDFRPAGAICMVPFRVRKCHGSIPMIPMARTTLTSARRRTELPAPAITRYFERTEFNRFLSTASEGPLKNEDINFKKLSWPGKVLIRFILAYRDYGLTALTFHACFAGFSILFWWYFVYNGYDVVGFLARLGFVSPFKLLLSNIQQYFGAASFPLAYSIHKAFFPLRAIITGISTPLIVRQLRKKHIFKLPPGMRP